MILADHGKHVLMGDIRAAAGVSRDCMNVADMVAGVRHFGLDCKVLKREPGQLAALGLPVIVYQN